jgi:hypothetical protein
MWEGWGDSCYKFPSSPEDIAITWDAAGRKCAQQAGTDYTGYLASIHTAAENDYIYSRLADTNLATAANQIAFIGLKREVGR